MSSTLGSRLGLTADSTWDKTIDMFANITDHSGDIQYATTDTSNYQASCYRLNGGYAEVIPALGYWGAWNWDLSCIRVPITNCRIHSAIDLNTERAGVTGIWKSVSVPSTCRYAIVCFVSIRYGQTTMSQSGVSIYNNFVQYEVNASADYTYTWIFYGEVTPGGTIALNAAAHNGSNHAQASSGCVIFFE